MFWESITESSARPETKIVRRLLSSVPALGRAVGVALLDACGRDRRIAKLKQKAEPPPGFHQLVAPYDSGWCSRSGLKMTDERERARWESKDCFNGFIPSLNISLLRPTGVSDCAKIQLTCTNLGGLCCRWQSRSRWKVSCILWATERFLTPKVVSTKSKP